MSKTVWRLIHCILKSIHASSIPFTPRTCGTPSIRTLKLQLKLSSSGVSLYSLFINVSGSAERLMSSVIFSPLRSVSSRTSVTSFIFPDFTKSATVSIIASAVVVYGISKISMQLFFLSTLYLARTLKLPLPVS